MSLPGPSAPYQSPVAGTQAHRRRTGRRREPRIIDLATHPRDQVSIQVAAEYLGLDVRTVKARMDDGEIDGHVDGRRWRIPLESLRAYALRRGYVPHGTA
jgi:excisionase family DNA binding protein